MPKLTKLRFRALRSKIFAHKSICLDPNMASSTAKASKNTPELESLRNLVKNLVFSLAVREKPTKYEGFEDEFLCSKCSNFLHHPVTSRCVHSFCPRCSEDAAYCKHCKKEQDPPLFSKLNVVLDTIIEHWHPEQYGLCNLVSDGDDLMKKGSFAEAQSKFTEAIQKNPYDIYAIMRRALAYKELDDWEGALEDVVLAKVRKKYIPEEFKSNVKNFQNIAAQVESVVQKSVKMFIEVMSLLGGPSSSSASPRKETFSGETSSEVSLKCLPKDLIGETGNPPISSTENQSSEILFISDKKISDLDDALESIITGNMSDFGAIFEKSSSESNVTSDTRGSVSKRDCENSDGFDENDFSCVLCTRPFSEPVCTPCGHTFCLDCLERCFDHGRSCPICKTSLKCVYEYQNCLLSVDWSVDSIIRNYLPNVRKERDALRLKEREELRTSLPIFVCAVAYPTVQCNLHVFEPRYRLLIRRTLRIHDGSFGITIPSSTAPFHAVGTIIHIENVSFYQDGRSMVKGVGTKRFEVQKYSSCDGYNTANVKYIFDEEETEENDIKETKKMAAEVYGKARKWYDSCPSQLKSQVKTYYGDFPEQDETLGQNGPNWAWWVLAVLPVMDDVKVYVLAKNRLRTRLAVLNLILRKLQTQSSEQ